MKKRYLAAGLVGAFFAGAAVYGKRKANREDMNKDSVLMYPVCRVTEQEDVQILTPEQLHEMAELVVVGRVQKIYEPRWNNPENLQPASIRERDVIYTDYSIEISSVLKSRENDDIPGLEEVCLRSYEGTVNGFSVIDNTQVVLSEGNDIIAYLCRDTTNFNDKGRMNQAHYIPAGNGQGIFVQRQQDASQADLATQHIHRYFNRKNTEFSL